MRRILNTNIFSTFFLTLILFVLTSLTWAEDVSIKVDGAKISGPVPKIYSSSIWIQNLKNIGGASYTIDKFFKDNKPATVQLSIPILQKTKSFEDFKKTLNNYFNTPAGVSFIKKATEYDSLVIIGFDPCPMPVWLSSHPGNLAATSDWGGTVQACSPPKDYKLWGEVIKFTLNYLRSLGLSNLGIYIGHEQERDWIGNEESFFKYYAETARAAKSVDKKIKVGGPGSVWDKAKRHECETYKSTVRSMCVKDGGWEDPDGEPFIKNFVEFVSDNNVPIDFINWHAFNVIPVGFVKTAELIKGWLKNKGLKNVQLYPADWSYWSFPPYPDDSLDGHEIAAYIPVATYYMNKAGIKWHAHDFDVRDYGGRENPVKKERNNSTFIGDWSIFTWGGISGGGIIKPMYNSLKALSMLAYDEKNRPNTLIETRFPEEKTVVAFSTLSNNKKEVSLMLSNFIPEDKKRFAKYIFSKLKIQKIFSEKEMGLMKECIIKNGGNNVLNVFSKCKNKLIALEKNQQQKRLKSRNIQEILENLSNARRNPQKVEIHFNNIPFNGKSTLTTYTIDSTHSNACTYNKRTEPIKTNTPCGIGGVIDKGVWEAKKKAKKKAVEVVKDHLMSLGYKNKDVELLKGSVERCKGAGRIKKCLANFIERAASKFNYTPGKVRKDFREAITKYKEVFNTFYYRSIDKINDFEGVSLEGSGKIRKINIKDNKYGLTLNMEPNSIWMVILSKE